MKKILLTFLSCLTILIASAQPKPKQKQPSQADMNKMMEEAMKAEGMSKEEQEEMKKMMGDIMPAIMEKNATTANYPEFKNNKELIPAKNVVAINAASKKKLSAGEIATFASSLYTKLLAKGNAEEIKIVKSVIAKTPKANDISAASMLCMMQGHPEAALALSAKAVQLNSTNTNYQNNMAALLTQYGYPEQAIPVLNKLKIEFPGNSTILNNLAHAWLGLGATDSASKYANAAILINPNHPEAMQCGGLMQELKGDPIKKYTDAMENAVNPFTEELIKNRTGSQNITLDFEKIKRNIAIHKYFAEEWMIVPALSNDVKNHNEDLAVKNGYTKMIEKLRENIEVMTEQMNKDLDNLVDKGEDEFVKEMAKESMKGLSLMSKPAVTVLRVLINYELKWQKDYNDTLKKILNWKEGLNKQRQLDIKKIYDQIDDSKGTSCKQFKTRLDEVENMYMHRVNTRLHKFLILKADEYREWLNAWVTWNWYVAGNVKNTVMLQNIQFAGHLAEVYAQVVQNMETFPEHCTAKPSNVTKEIAAPQIPNFSCPAVVSIPVGPEWQQLSNAAKNFDKNIYNIKKAANPVPNVSIGYGTGNMIAQPGIAPFAKTANGSITPAILNSSDDDLAPLSFNPPKSQREIMDAARSELTNQLLKKMMQTSCTLGNPDPKVKMLNKIIKDAIADLRKEVENEKNKVDPKAKMLDDIINAAIDEQAKILMNEAIALHREMKEGKVGIVDYYKQMEKIVGYLDKWERVPTIDKIYEAMDVINSMMKSTNVIKNGPAVLNEIEQNGIQSTISSGMQVPNTFTPIKGLFN